MKFKIHFSIGDYEDYFIVEGDSWKEIKKACKAEVDSRGLSVDKNNIWSEQI